MPSKIRVWILQNGEELPSDPGPPRLLRQGILAETLAERGHDVTYWTSTFNHQQKFQRASEVVSYRESRGYGVTLLPARRYSGHVSLGRIRSHQEAAAAFRSAARDLQPPDVLISGYPTIEFAHSGVRFASGRGVASIVDFRDQWPDIISQRIGPRLRPVASPLLGRWRQMQRYAVRHATSVVGISDEFVDWALAVGHRPRGPLDRAFHLAPPAGGLTPQQVAGAQDFWSDAIGDKADGHVWGVYAGNLSSRTDIATVAAATRRLSAQAANRLRIIVCGGGDTEPLLRQLSDDNPVLVLAGQRNAAEVRVLLGQADFGIVPYLNSSDFLMSYPNKVGEQLSHGLPILTGLEGVTGSLLSEQGVQLPYRPTDVASCVLALETVTAAGVTSQQRARARQIYRDQFNPDIIYPSYADHVEVVARSASGLTATRRRTP